MKFKDIEDISSLPTIEEENFYSSASLQFWYDGPLYFFATYQSKEVFVYSIDERIYKVFELKVETADKVKKDEIVSKEKGNWWDFLEDEECIGIWSFSNKT